MDGLIGSLEQFPVVSDSAFASAINLFSDLDLFLDLEPATLSKG